MVLYRQMPITWIWDNIGMWFFLYPLIKYYLFIQFSYGYCDYIITMFKSTLCKHVFSFLLRDVILPLCSTYHYLITIYRILNLKNVLKSRWSDQLTDTLLIEISEGVLSWEQDKRKQSGGEPFSPLIPITPHDNILFTNLMWWTETDFRFGILSIELIRKI